MIIQGGNIMASMQEYCELLSTTQLQAILLEEFEGRGNLPMEAILTVCDALAKRDASLPAVHETLRSLCRAYLP